jgi:hypothetical protein
MVVLCLAVSLLLLSQLSSANTGFRVDETSTRILLEEQATKISLALVNPSGRELAARVRLEVLDPDNRLRASTETDERIKGGASALVLSLPLQLGGLDKRERNELLWYRLRYRITPQQSAAGDMKSIEGIVSLSEITPDLFELRIIKPESAREGSLYHVRALAVHPVSSRPVQGVAVEAEIIYDDGSQRTTVKASGVTDAEGYAPLLFNLPQQAKDDAELEMKIRATRGGLTEETDTEIELEHQALVLMSTDKPLYQPGQTLHLRALCFDSLKRALSNASARLTIADPEGTNVFRAPLVTSRFGIASLDWPIPENTRLGDYQVTIELDDDRYDEQEITQTVKISRYDLPNFAVSVKPDRPFYLPGQDAEVIVSADYLFGQPVKRGKVRVVRETEREWNYREQKWETTEGEKYEGETDAEGRYNVRLNLQQEHANLASEDHSRFQDLTYAAYFTDPTTNRTEQRRFDLRLTKDAIHIYVSEGIERQAKNFPIQFYLATYYADGTPAECEVEIKDAASNKDGSGGQTLRTLKTNRYGVAKVKGLRLPQRETDESEFVLNFLARDRQGALGRQGNNFWYADNPVIRLETNKSLYRAGEPIKATITASQNRLKLFLDVWKGWVVVRSQTVELRDGRAQLTIPYSADFDANITLTAYAAPDAAHAYYYYNWPADSRQVLYPRERDLRLDVQLSQPTYKPGEEAHADFRVSTPGGQAVESALGVVIIDKAVEERARTDREFGSSYGFYGAYRYLSGDNGQVSGVSIPDLLKLDMSKPIPDGLETVAEVLLRAYSRVPRVHSGESFQMSQQQVFAKLIERQVATMKDVLAKRYAEKMEYPREVEGLRALLGAAGVDVDKLLDPWDTPYRPRFLLVRESDVLELRSAGADKRFETDDDFTALSISWPYFRPLGESINHAVINYHARTGKFIRDMATLKEEMRAAGIDLDTLRDRWGKPYRFYFDVAQINYQINIKSGGPDGEFEHKGAWDPDNFTVWTTQIDYFSAERSRIDKALIEFERQTERFPQNTAELHNALGRSQINLEDLRDPWGRNYYATFSSSARNTDQQIIRTYSNYGETGKLRQEIKTTPVTQRSNYIYLHSRGEDGKEGTYDDFNIALFSRISTEQSVRDKQLQVVRPAIIYSGTTGAIGGTIVDMQGAAVPGSLVKATHLATSQQYEADSDDNGRYVLRNLPVGLYRVEFTYSGFAVQVIDQVPVRSSNLTKLDVTMQAGAVTEMVNISSGGTVELNASTMTSTQISNLPIQRRVLPLSLLSPAKASRTSENRYQLDGVSEEMETPRLRENFSETLLWQPSLETDRDGRARLDFKMADNITTWKMAAIGSTVNGEIGLVEKEIVAFQPFFVEHDPPRVLTEGDEIQLPVVVRNYLDRAQDVNLQIAPAAWFTLLGPADKRVNVPAGDASRQTFDFRASASIKNGSQQITARAAGGGDAIVKPVSVHPDGEEVATTASQIMSQATALNFNFPQNTIKNSARAELKIYPDLMAHVFESVEGILRRPYGCGEQTISSTYPSLLVLRHDKRMGQQSPVSAKALRYLRAGYERLLNYHTPGGGFSYWGGRSEADLALTAYALRFLNDAKAFIEVDEGVINATRDWLIKQQQPDGSWNTSTSPHADKRQSTLLTAYIARVLAANGLQAADAQATTATQSKPAEAGVPEQSKPAQLSSLQRALAYLSRRVEEIDEPYLLASYALAARDAGDIGAATRATAKLRTLAREEGDTTYWSLETNTPFYGWGLAGRIETTALVLQALARENVRDDALVGRGLLFLLRQKDRYGVWYSTQATINVLDALITLLSRERQTDLATTTAGASDGGVVVVIINGQRATEVKMPNVGQSSGQLVVDLSPFLAPGENRVELQRKGAGRAMPASVQVVATYYIPWSAVVSKNHMATTANASSMLNLKLGFDKSETAIGEEVTCKVLAERIGHVGYGMLLAEIGLPPGADVDRASLEKAMKESGWTFSRYDILPDRLVVYLWPRAGGTSFEFKFRTRFGLVAQTAASQVYDYYNPEARAVVAPTKFIVK